MVRFWTSRIRIPHRREWQSRPLFYVSLACTVLAGADLDGGKQGKSGGLRWAMLLILGFFVAIFVGPSHSYAAPRAVNWPLIILDPIATDFESPVNIVSPNDGTNRLFIVEQGGKIHIIQNGVRLEDNFMDVRNKVVLCPECGLLGLAFPPDFANKNYFFVSYISKTDFVPPDTGDPDPTDIGDIVIARYRLTADRNIANPNSEEKILVINKPAANHNSGHLIFGPDNYLYIGVGDGGGGGDEFQNAQNPESLHGKILRIEVGATGTYTVPSDNPFIDTPNYREEIWAMGLRNPWRFNFDRVTGDLYIADVGQNIYEEVNHVAQADIGVGGMNFGWPILEGLACFPPQVEECDSTGFTQPVITYDHSLGDCSVTGGFVYHSSLPNQPPIYLYGDYCGGRLWGLQPEGEGWASIQLDDFNFQITSFGEEVDGTLYLASYSGTIYRLRDPLNARYLPALLKGE